MAVTFDLFDTLVTATYPSEPAAVIAEELRSLGVAVPPDWSDAYVEPHIDAPDGAEVPLPAHVSAALASRGVDFEDSAVRRAVINAFDPEVETRPGAVAAVDAAANSGPVGICSNCSVPELVSRTLIRSALDRASFDAIVTSVACGWRKPHPKAFETVASRLGCPVESITHVGDNPATDGGITACGGRFVNVTETSLSALADRFEASV